MDFRGGPEFLRADFGFIKNGREFFKNGREIFSCGREFFFRADLVPRCGRGFCRADLGF